MTTTEQRIRELLFGATDGGPITVTNLSLQPWIHLGFSVAALRNVAGAMGVRETAMAAYLGVSTRTLQRVLTQEHLTSAISDRLAMITRLLAFGEVVLGSVDEAQRWFAASQVALDGRRPLDLMQTVTGALEVEQLLGRIYHGVYT
ncbi:MAG: DUF2384 domain-containing protein [Candidatus Kapabacteria bacterium]|nr:DUF2384 domain-containing protein [Candidatus Kapabacteria bacterium]